MRTIIFYNTERGVNVGKNGDVSIVWDRWVVLGVIYGLKRDSLC